MKSSNRNYIDKFCMASSYIFRHCSIKEMIEDNLNDGYSQEEARASARECKKFYDVLSKIFSDAEIKAMADIVNNLPEKTEAYYFKEIERGDKK